MPATWRNIRTAFLLQVAIVCLVVVLGMLAMNALNGEVVQPVTIVAICIALLAIVSVTWMTYRAARHLLAPMHWLLREVGRWDPADPDTGALAAINVPSHVQGDARRMADALHALGLRLQAHVERERDFTRDASHELRTPLTVIRVASDMAMAEDSPPRVARALQRIQRAGRDMEAVIDAFLILAREAEVEPQSEDFDVADIVMDEAENARALLLNKPVDLEVTLHARPRLHAPPRVFQVVVSNLLRNACSYTDRGRIDVILEPDRVIVRDTGIGMSAESMVRVFEPFYRADPSRPQGSGLGLSIVSRLCDRFGWKIELDSELGRGTTATIRFVP